MLGTLVAMAFDADAWNLALITSQGTMIWAQTGGGAH